MYIKRDPDPPRGPAEQLLAMDDLGRRLGRAGLYPRMNELEMPDRPFEVEIDVSGRNEAKPRLLAAATVRAMLLIRAQDPPVPSRIYCPCGPKDMVLLETLKSIGYESGDALVRMTRRDLGGLSTAHPPKGTLLIRDRVDDPLERRYFTERLERLHGMESGEAWLNARENEPLFQRFLLTSRDGLAGEGLCHRQPDGRGVIDLVYTAPAWRKQGVGLCLMEAMRVHLSSGGVEQIAADVRQRNQPATALMYASGYRIGQTLRLLPGIDL
ncbi:MAG: GNAT family N-acetyltransferase [Clostridia bacterium]|nr:GNAT family N-acetyltransferase [Clostridia bacterium]